MCKNEKYRSVQTHNYGFSTKPFPAPQRERFNSWRKEDKFKLTRKNLKCWRKQMLVVFGKEGNISYKKSPLAKNKVGKLFSEAAENNGLQGRLANHSVRGTWILRLLSRYVPGDYVACLHEYPNLKILDLYKSPFVQHQRRMSFTLSPSANVRATRASSSSFTSFVDIHQKEQSQSLAVKSYKLGIFY